MNADVFPTLVQIMTDPVTGASRGFGFVRFSNESDCLRALVEMQGIFIAPLDGQSTGRPLRVCPATPKNKAANGGPGAGYDAELGNKAYAGITGNSSNPAFAAARGPHMPPPSLSTGFTGASAQQPPRLDPYGAQSPGAASPLTGLPQAYQLLQASQQRTTRDLSRDPSAPLPGVSHASAAAMTSSALDPNNTTVFVGGLSSLISEDTLRTFFVPFGEIAYVKIPPGKGCGFVQFVRKIDAERAIERMQGFPIGGGRIRLSWGRSQGDKAAAAAAQAAAQAAQLGQLANLAGLGGLSASQLAQLAGLSSALSAMQQSSGASPLTPALGRPSELDANTAILQRLAAASAGISAPPQQQTPAVETPSHYTPAGDHFSNAFSGASPAPPPVSDPREAELLRSMYAHLASQGRAPQQAQAQHQQQQQPLPPFSGDRAAADQLAAALSGMDLRGDVGRQQYQPAPQHHDFGSAAGFSGSSPAPWQNRPGNETEHRASPQSMVKASTFAPFSPTDSPVAAEASLAPEQQQHHAGSMGSASQTYTSYARGASQHTSEQ